MVCDITHAIQRIDAEIGFYQRVLPPPPADEPMMAMAGDNGDDNQPVVAAGSPAGGDSKTGVGSEFVKGLVQGLANIANGLQHIGVGFLNLAQQGARNDIWIINKTLGLDLPMPARIQSPDWSRDLVTHEAGEPGTWSDSHGWSVAIGGESAATLITVGVARLASAGKASEAVKTIPNNATGFRGSRGLELSNSHLQPTRNVPTNVNGRNYTAHSLDQMQNRGLFPSVIEETIKRGKMSSVNSPGIFKYYDPTNRTTVIIGPNGVITVY